MSKHIKDIKDFKNTFFPFLPVRFVKWLFEKVSDVSINSNNRFHGNNSNTTKNGGLNTDKAKEIADNIKDFLKSSFIGKIIFTTILIIIILLMLLIILNINSINAFFRVLFSEKFNFTGYMNANYPKINM